MIYGFRIRCTSHVSACYRVRMFLTLSSTTHMKKSLLSMFMLAAAALPSQAQISLAKTDMPSSGQTIYRSQATLSGALDYLTSGANQLWDFSQLAQSTEDTSNYVSISSTPFAYQFYFNNAFLYPNYKADFAIKAPDFPSFPGIPITISNVYNYYKNNNTEYAQVGFGASVSGLPTSIRLDSLDYLYHYPVNFGNADSCISKFSASVPSVGYIKERKKRRNVVDGWGILRLPNDTTHYRVLRVKTVINQVDSVHLDTLGFTFPVTRNSVEYKWIGKGFSEPLLQITTNVGNSGNQTVSGVTYKYTAPNTSGMQELSAEALVLRDNPANCCLQFSSPSGEYVMYSAGGALAGAGRLERAGSQEVSVSHLSAGLYLMQVTAGGHVYRTKFVKAN